MPGLHLHPSVIFVLQIMQYFGDFVTHC